MEENDVGRAELVSWVLSMNSAVLEVDDRSKVVASWSPDLN